MLTRVTHRMESRLVRSHLALPSLLQQIVTHVRTRERIYASIFFRIRSQRLLSFVPRLLPTKTQPRRSRFNDVRNSISSLHSLRAEESTLKRLFGTRAHYAKAHSLFYHLSLQRHKPPSSYSRVGFPLKVTECAFLIISKAKK